MKQDKGILLFYDWLENVKADLNGDEFKALIYALASYKKDGTEPDDLQGVAGFAWKLLKGDIDRYNQKRDAGKKGGTERAKREREAKSASSTLEGCLNSASSTLEGCFNNHTIPYNTIPYNTIQDNTKDLYDSLPTVENCAADAPRSTERDDLPKSTRGKRDGDSLTEKCRPIVEYLNERTSSNYRPSTKATQAHISARLKEGYTIDDFKAVIDRKVNEWQGTDYERFLTPDTLFGTKFEKYLNAKPRSRAPEPNVEHLLDGIL